MKKITKKNKNKNDFQRLYGINEKAFKYALKILEKGYTDIMKLGGRPSKLNCEDKLKITLQYLRQYRTYYEIGQDFGIFKESKRIVHKNTIILGDSGYTGMKKYHKNCKILIRKRKNKIITKKEKQFNQKLKKKRIKINM